MLYKDECTDVINQAVLFSAPIFWPLRYMMKFIPETHIAN